MRSPQASSPKRHDAALATIFAALGAAYGGEHWHWMPAAVRGPFDVIAGAVLVQHTTWTNAERALESLRAAGALDARVLGTMSEEDIAGLVRVSGTPRVKARRLRALAETIVAAGGLGRVLALPIEELRPLLLGTHGVGPETADAIALYAAEQRTFVIDAYTTRLFRRLGFGPAGDTYAEWQSFFERALAGDDAAAFQRYHAWIVLHGKARCRAKPECTGRPLLSRCAFGRVVVSKNGAAT